MSIFKIGLVAMGFAAVSGIGRAEPGRSSVIEPVILPSAVATPYESDQRYPELTYEEDLANRGVIRVVKPNGGEVWRAGSTYRISWKRLPEYSSLPSIGRKTVSIDLLRDGKDVLHLANVTSRWVTSYRWRIPRTLPQSDNYTIRISVNVVRPWDCKDLTRPCPLGMQSMMDANPMYYPYFPDFTSSDNSDAPFTILNPAVSTVLMKLEDGD